MKRRDLLKAIGLGLGWPQGRPGRRRRREAPAWSFRLDDSSRWSLVSRRGLPAVEGGEIAVTLLGRPATPLGALDRVHRVRLADAGNGGAGWQIVGTTSGVEVTAQLLDGPPPLITVTARGLAEPQRLEEIRFLDTSTADVPCLESDDAAGGRPLLWINGYESGDECRLLALDDAGQDTSHWQLAVLPAPVGTSRRRAPAGLALSFGAEDGGRGEFTIASPHLAAASRFSGRPVGMALPPVATSLAVVPGDDPLAALGQLAASHLPSLAGGSPSGWCSWYELGAAVTEADLLDNLAAARERIGPTALHVIQLDDGYQRAAGDWETNAKFPHGHRWLTERIHAAGFRAGLWMAPFAVAERSGIPVGHPDWLLQTAEGQPLVLAEREDWGGKVYGLDAAQRPVRDYLRNLARHAVAEWGYDYLKLDGLGYGAAGTRTDRQLSPAEAYRAGLRALREGAGRAFVVGCHAPLQHAAGLVDGMRIGPDVGTSFDRLQSAARGVGLRAHLHASAWLNDPDCLLVREPLTTEEARAWATIVALCGGSSLATDRLDRLPADRVEILQRVMPVAGLPVRARGAPDLSPPGMPEWFLAQVRSDWWVAAAVNWTDGPRPMGLSLAEVGIRGPLAVYDVWAERRLADVDDVVSVAVDAHAVAALALRRRRAVPFVLGSTRHVVQGAVDLAEERWDGRRRSLRGRSVGLDGRPYAVTIALPPGFLPAEAQTDPESDAVIVMGERAARLIVPAPGEEVAWEVRF